MSGSSQISGEAAAYSPQGRAERLIALGRVALAVFHLLAIQLDPSEPAKFARTAHHLLLAYLGYAVALALVLWRSPTPLVRLRFPSHVIDLAIFTALMYFTKGTASPFYVCFAFSLLSGTLRWQFHGTLLTAGAALAIFMGMGLSAILGHGDLAVELNEFITRTMFLAVMATLLSYLGTHEERYHQQLAKLADWPPTPPQETRALERQMRQMLEYAAGVLGAPRVLLASEQRDGPWLNLAYWSRGEFQATCEPPAKFRPLVAEPLEGTDFLCLDARAPLPTVLHPSPGGWKRWQGAPVHPDLLGQFGMNTVLSVCLRGDNLRIRLFFLDKPGMTSDNLLLGGVVVRQVAARMAQFSLLERQRHVAAMEERIRLAHELHDGAIQSLAGTALQLQNVRSLLEEEGVQAAERCLGRVQRLIDDEVRELRFFFRGLRPGSVDSPEKASNLTIRLGELVTSFQTIWGLSADLRAEPVTAPIPANLAYEAARIVREALVNAAKHARASAVRVELGVRDGHVRITVADNGRGFPFRGQYDHAALTRLKLGPVCLKERVESLGGSLAIASAETGARLDIFLPLGQPGAGDDH